MDERDRFPAPPSADEGLGALTGATGSLTPDDPDEAFVPAETAEVTDAEAARGLTAAAHHRREERTSMEPDEPGRLRQRGERTAPNDRDGGYGSEHGLAADDPAYREEDHLSRPAPRAEQPGPTRLGGDEAHGPETEHL